MPWIIILLLLIAFLVALFSVKHGSAGPFILFFLGGGLLITLNYIAVDAARQGHPWAHGDPAELWNFGLALGGGALIGLLLKLKR